MASSTLGTVVKFGAIGLGVWWVYESFFAPKTTAATAVAPVPPTTTTTTTVATAPAATSTATSGLQAIYNAMVAAAASDPKVAAGQASVSVWNYWLQSALGSQMPNGGYAPGAPADPTPLTAAQYWTYAGPTVQTIKGLTGLLNGLRGLRGFVRAPHWHGTAIKPGYLS